MNRLIVIMLVIGVIIASGCIYVVFYPLLVPNLRTYTNENIRAIGRVYPLRTLHYKYLELGNPTQPLRAFPQQLYLRQGGSMIELHETIPTMLDAMSSRKTSVPDSSGWPNGSQRVTVGSVHFYVHDDDVLGMSVGPVVTVPIELSRDGNEWFDFPLTQEEVNNLFGEDGRIVDHFRR